MVEHLGDADRSQRRIGQAEEWPDLTRRSFETTLPLYARSQVQSVERWDTLQNFLKQNGYIDRTFPPVPTVQAKANRRGPVFDLLHPQLG